MAEGRRFVAAKLKLFPQRSEMLVFALIINGTLLVRNRIHFIREQFGCLRNTITVLNEDSIVGLQSDAQVCFGSHVEARSHQLVAVGVAEDFRALPRVHQVAPRLEGDVPEGNLGQDISGERKWKMRNRGADNHLCLRRRRRKSILARSSNSAGVMVCLLVGWFVRSLAEYCQERRGSGLVGNKTFC